MTNTNVRVFDLVAPGAKTTLNDKFSDLDGFDGGLLMDPGKVVDVAIRGLVNDKFDIYPGSARIMKIMSRLAPQLLLNQTSKVGAKAMQ